MGVRAGEYGRQFPEKGRENVAAIWKLAAEGRLKPRSTRNTRWMTGAPPSTPSPTAR